MLEKNMAVYQILTQNHINFDHFELKFDNYWMEVNNGSYVNDCE